MKKGGWRPWFKFGVFVLVVAAGLIFWVMQPLFPLSTKVAADDDPVEVSVLRSHVEFLAGVTGRRNFTQPATLARAAAYIEAAFTRAGGRVRSEWFEVAGERYRNVIADFGPEGLPALVVGAHYDAEQHTAGADDNASGVAGLLELAAALGRRAPERTVEVVAYTLEEPPFFATDDMGSRHHAAALVAAGGKPDLILVLECIGYFDDRAGSQSYPIPGMEYLYPEKGDYLAVVGNFLSPRLVRRVKADLGGDPRLPVYSINAPAWVPGVSFSDHASYWPYGLPAVMLTDTAFYRNDHYHEASDLPASLDYPRLALVVQGVVSLVRNWH